jgi:excisionase family DNA binding protein
MLSIQDAEIIRDLRTDYKIKWLEQIIKSVIKESINELRDEDKKLRDEDKLKVQKPKPLNIQQIADRFEVSKATVHNWMKRGSISGFKMGKGRFFHLDEVEKSLANNKYYDVLERKDLVE